MRSFLSFFRFYYRLAGNKLFGVLCLMFAAVSFQGIGLGLFLPILQGEDSTSQVAMVLKKGFGLIGLEYKLQYLLGLLVGTFFLRAICLGVQALAVTKVITDLLVDLRCTIAQKIFRLDYQAFLNKPTGYLNNALIIEFSRAVYSFESFANFLVSILFVILYVGIPLYMNPVLVVILGVIGIPAFFVIRAVNSITRTYSVKTSRHSAGLQKILIQSLNYYKYLKATAEYPRVLKEIFFQSRMLGNLQLRQSALGVIMHHGFEPFAVLIVACLIYYYVAVQGKNIIEQSFLLYLVYSAMNRIIALQNNFRKLLSTWGSIQVFTELEEELELNREETQPAAAATAVDFMQPLCFRNVSFRFRNGPEVIHAISIEIQPNTTVAFVGDSGAGKTTIVNILVGLLRPTDGNLFLGTDAYGGIDRETLRRNVGYITQESVVFNDTIYNNITLWDERDRSQTLPHVYDAAQKARIAEFIDGLERKYETLLGESGITISGGQRQRICIARELYKDIKILIFDEATSSLDTKTERQIQKNIDEFRGQKTIVLVAHRLSTVRNVDKIFVLKDGCVVETGTYEQLYNAGGEFRAMVDRQDS